MERELDQLVDEMLDDSIQRWMQDHELDPAAHVNECGRRGDFRACAELRSRRTFGRWEKVRLRGRCAEEMIVDHLCEQGFGIRNQVLIQPDPRALRRILDITSMPGEGRLLLYGIESKYVRARGYLQDGAAGLARLRRRVQQHVRQVRDQMRRSTSATARRALPSEIRLWYSIGETGTPQRYRLVVRTIRAELSAINQRRLPPVRARFSRVGF